MFAELRPREMCLPSVLRPCCVELSLPEFYSLTSLESVSSLFQNGRFGKFAKLACSLDDHDPTVGHPAVQLQGP
jgi:hypothetical protein